MKFSEIVEHLGKRGFVTRKLWRDKAALFFGMDNIAYFVCPESPNIKMIWTPNLDEIWANDWIIILEYWGDCGDDFKVFDKNEIKKELYNGQEKT